MSSALAKPWRMLKPLTPAVMEPRVMAARAVVEMWPIDTTETITREYSSKWVLQGCESCMFCKMRKRKVPKDRKSVFCEDEDFLPEHG